MQAQPAQSTPIAVSNEDDVLTGTIRVIPDLTTALPGDNNVHKWADKSIHVARSLHEWWGRARATIDTADILRVRYTPGSGRRNIELVEPHKDYIWLGSKAWRSDNPPELEQGYIGARYTS
ncbi:hypothetical protein FRB99_006068 [Tulasnella sp. 403]|nr:hypothetical protein FRB99_006068 [Tulasnella sp. 403]